MSAFSDLCTAVYIWGRGVGGGTEGGEQESGGLRLSQTSPLFAFRIFRQLLDNNIETIEAGAFDDLISLQSL